MLSIAGLEQLRSGFLGVVKMDMFVKKHTDLLRDALAAPTQTAITAVFIQDEFKPILSPKGSNNLPTEEELIILWNRYLEHVEGKSLLLLLMLSIIIV